MRPTPLVMLDPRGSQVRSARRFAHVLLSASNTGLTERKGTFRLNLSDLPPEASPYWRLSARRRHLMEPLATQPCWFPQLSASSAAVPLVESWHSSNDVLEWRFEARVATGVIAWAAWSRINLGICLQCRRRGTLSLFELLSGMLAAGHRTWTATLDDLRCVFGAWNAWPNWDVISPLLHGAVSELNTLAPFVVRYRPLAIRSFCVGVRFEISPWGMQHGSHRIRSRTAYKPRQTPYHSSGQNRIRAQRCDRQSQGSGQNCAI
jgi:hypothetical protein